MGLLFFASSSPSCKGENPTKKDEVWWNSHADTVLKIAFGKHITTSNYPHLNEVFVWSAKKSPMGTGASFSSYCLFHVLDGDDSFGRKFGP